MANFINDLYDRFNELHSEIEKALDGSTPETLDWIPGVEMNSIAIMVVHLLGAEHYWIGVALNEAPARDREAEFKAKGLAVNELINLIVSTDDYAQKSLARLSLNSLEDLRQSPRNSKSFSVGWCLAHALEHTALHTGHIQLTRQLWEQRRGS